jgi:hypothetical protein
MQFHYAREFYAEFGVPYHEQDCLSWAEFLTMCDAVEAIRKQRKRQEAGGGR